MLWDVPRATPATPRGSEKHYARHLRSGRGFGLSRCFGAPAILWPGLIGVRSNGTLDDGKGLAYWIMKERTLGVVVADGIYIKCEVVRVDEASDSVRIWAECLEPLLPVPMAAALTLNVLRVSLQATLPERSVLDGSGNPVTLCHKPAPDCLPPLQAARARQHPSVRPTISVRARSGAA